MYTALSRLHRPETYTLISIAMETNPKTVQGKDKGLRVKEGNSALASLRSLIQRTQN